MTKRKLKLRAPLSDFAQNMEIRLRENDHKGGWADCSLPWLRERLESEARELEKALDIFYFGDWGEPTRAFTVDCVMRECADVANFAMMISDVIATMTAGKAKAEIRKQRGKRWKE